MLKGETSVFKKLSSKKGEGILTGILWMATVAVVTGGIALAIWTGISATGVSSKTSSTNAFTTSTNSAKLLAP